MTFYNPRSESLGGGNGAKYFLLEGLPKLILSKNKLHQEQGHKSMMQILQKQPFIEKILYYLALLVPYDNQYLRLCFSQYLQVILQAVVENPSSENIEFIKQSRGDLIDYFLMKLLCDNKPDVQVIARSCFELYQQICPQSSYHLILYGIPASQFRSQMVIELGLDEYDNEKRHNFQFSTFDQRYKK